ncbi:MAG: hypothetical protein JWP57_4475, partial [Spirosoma sp.]|nr:hypothetical protein [Spirosoma sp.]
PTAPATASPTKDGKKGRSDGNDPMSQEALNARPGQGPLPSDRMVSCPATTVRVSTAGELTRALENAKPGDVISLADGTYTGEFTAKTSGTATSRIFLCGSRNAVLDTGDTDNGYVFYLNGASNWVLSGFTAQNGQKGIVTDESSNSIIEGLTVTNIGDEAIHLRKNSSSNLVIGNTVSNTGNRNKKFGEGIYIGSAVSNWCTYNDCLTDQSNYNIIADNDISGTTAENIDIKEGTIGGIVKGNRFDGGSMTSSTAWINVKGNAWTIRDNHGQNSPQDGYQTHNILQQWGDYNLFTGNTGSVDAVGYAFALRPAMHNTVSCSNTVTGAKSGLSNIPCTNP